MNEQMKIMIDPRRILQASGTVAVLTLRHDVLSYLW